LSKKNFNRKGDESCYSGAIRGISIPGSELEKYGMINEHP